MNVKELLVSPRLRLNLGKFDGKKKNWESNFFLVFDLEKIIKGKNMHENEVKNLLETIDKNFLTKLWEIFGKNFQKNSQSAPISH